jgi:hypothetical protein
VNSKNVAVQPTNGMVDAGMGERDDLLEPKTTSYQAIPGAKLTEAGVVIMRFAS